MANIVGQVNLNGCNYQVGYDLLGQNIAGNYSTVRFYGILNVTNNYVSWSRGTASVWGASAGLATRYNRGSYTVVTQDVNIGHDNQGNYSGTISGTLQTTMPGGTGTASGGFSLPSIPRQANVTGATDFTDEQNPRITFSNPGGFRINARLEFGGTNIRRDNIPNTGSYTFNLTDSERNLLRSKTSNSNTMAVREVIATCIGGTTENYWSWQDKKMTIVNANPTFSTFDFEDTNSKTVALTGNNKSIISGYSNIKATISVDNKATAKKGATMVKYRLSVGDNSKDISYSSTAAVNGTVNKVTNSTINVYAIDSRNNSTLVSKQALKFYSYNPLEKGNISLERSDGGVGENVTLNYTGKIDLKNFGKVTNSIKTATYTLQRSDSSTITKGKTTITPTVSSNGSFSFTGLIKGDTTAKGFDIGSSYIITVTVTDELSSITFTSNLSSGTPNIALSKNGVSVMGKYDEELGGLLQVGGTIISTQKVLWTNPSPTDVFEAQTITLNSDDYDMIEIFYIDWVDTKRMMSVKFKKGYNSNLQSIFQANDTGYVGSRAVAYQSETSLNFSTNVTVILEQNLNRQERNDWNIPVCIVGYKTGLFN